MNKFAIRKLGLLLVLLITTTFGWAVRTDCTKFVSTSGSAAWGSCTSTGTTCSLLSASQNATAGERVCIMAGTYDLATINPVNGGLSIANSGSGSGATAGPLWYNNCPNCIVFQDYDDRAVTNLDVLIQFPLSSTEGHVNVIAAQGSSVSEAASWVIFKGLAVDGRQYPTAGFNFQWNHHLALIGVSSRNNISAGIGFQHGDYESVIGSVIYNNGDNPHNITTYATSCSQGITHNLNHSFDSYPGIHNIIFGNIVASSYCHTATHSDGRGYDLDNTDDATPRWTLVASNIFYGNGSAGESTNVNNPPATFAVCCVIFSHNTNYWNTLDLTLAVLKSDIDDRQSSNIYHIDEINVASTVNANANYNYSQSGVVTNPVYAKLAWQNGQEHNFTPSDESQFLHLAPGFQNAPVYNASAGLQWRPCTLYAAPCTSDPMTVLANGQFRLSTTSPYIGAGVDPVTVLTNNGAPAQVITDATAFVHSDITGVTFTTPPALGAYALALTPPGPNNYWVDFSTGLDTNPGTRALPWKTLTHADSALTLGSGATTNCGASYFPASTNVGACVHVVGGTYTQGEFTTSHNGTASQNIVFICDIRFSCLIRGTATGGSGVWLVNGANTQLIGFDVAGSPTYGVKICETTSGGCPNVVLGYNHIHNLTGTCANSPGGGGITGRDAINPLIIGNEVDHINVTAGGGRWCHGIYLGGGSGSRSGRIYNNWLHDNPNGWGIDLRQIGGDASWWFDVSNNTIVNNGTPTASCVPGACGGGMTLDTVSGASTNVTANNNIVWNNKGSSRSFGSSAGSCTGCSFNKNDMFGNTDSGYANISGQPAPLTVDPRLVSTSNPHLQATSPMIGAGTFIPCATGGSPCVPSIDADGNTRPSLPSIGAYEAAAAQSQFFVSNGGFDTNNGTSLTTPWKTIQHALNTFTLGPSGSVIHVANGTYNEDLSYSGNGSSTQRITLISDTQYGAHIVGQAAGGNVVHIGTGATLHGGNYVTVQNFEVTGTASNQGIVLQGNHDIAIGNKVHAIQRNGTCPSGGGLGIGTQWNGVTPGGGPSDPSGQNFNLIQGNIVYDIGNFPSLCNFTHGIYLQTPLNTAWANIVFHAAGYGVQTFHYTTQQIIKHNTIFQNSESGIFISQDNIVPDNFNTITNNIVVNNNTNNTSAGIRQGGTGTNNLISNNMTFGNVGGGYLLQAGSAVNQITTGTNATVFVNYTGNETGDYHLRAGSPAINAGTVACATGTCNAGNDFAGNPYASPPSLGAYEAGTVTIQPPTGLTATVN